MVEGGNRFDRRALLAGGIKAGIGLGLASRSAQRLLSSRHLLGDETSPGAPGVLGAEPLSPPNFSRYVSRPDITPVGVSIIATPELLELGPKRGYIFCAPKNPLAANPGRARRHPFSP